LSLHGPHDEIDAGGEELGGTVGERGRLLIVCKGEVNRPRDLGLVAADLLAVMA
jgi:hypothetical protein